MGTLQGLAELPPWLLAASAPERLRAALATAVPEIAAGDLVLSGCDAGHFRVGGAGWTFLCRIAVGRTGEEPRELELEGTLDRTASVRAPHVPVAALGSEEWRCRLAELGVELRTAPPDADLPLVPDLLDPERARGLLERALRTGSAGRPPPRLVACRPRLMRHDRGSRCTVLYELDHAPDVSEGTWPRVVVAKTHADDRGRNAHEAMRALWRPGPAIPLAAALAEPLAYVPELRLLVQGPVPEERSLESLLRSALRRPEPPALDEASRFVARAAGALAGLHRSGVTFGELRTLEGEVERICVLVERLGRHVPELPGAVMPVLAGVAAAAVRHPAQSPRPSHGTFRPGQVLLRGDALGIVDFDSFCQAEPAFDIARFRAGLRDCAMRDPVRPAGASAQLEALCDEFVRTYARSAQVSPERVMLWEALDLVTHVLHAWSRVKPSRLLARVVLLEEHAVRNGLIPAPAPVAEPGVAARSVDAA